MSEKFSELRIKMSLEAQVRSAARAEGMLSEMRWRELRNSRNVTQVQVARAMGVEQTAVSRVTAAVSPQRQSELRPDDLEGARESFNQLWRVARSRCEPQAFRAARYGRVVDRLHVDAVMLQQLIADALAKRCVSDHHRHDVAG